MTTPPADAAPRRFFTCLALLWLSGMGLRLTVLAVPPVIPMVHDDFNMSETQVGILSGLPPVLFALAAVPGSLLIARFGARATLIIGLLATAIGSALRGAAPNIMLLYAATALTGFGIAVMQPSMPPLVRTWLPTRIGFGTAVYTNGLLVGEILAVALTLPLVLPLVDNSWRMAFVLWGVPCVAIALAVLLLAPRQQTSPATVSAPRRWWPDWTSGTIWRLGLMLGSVNAMYFAANAFIPNFLRSAGHGDLIGPSLTWLNVGQLPASLLLLAVVGRMVGKPWPYALCGVLGLAAVAGIVFGAGWVIVAAAGLLGFATAAILVLILALPPLLSPPDDIHRMTAGMFTISYSCAVITPVISGLLWDLTDIPAIAFAPIALFTLVLIALAPTVRPPSRVIARS